MSKEDPFHIPEKKEKKEKKDMLVAIIGIVILLIAAIGIYTLDLDDDVDEKANMQYKTGVVRNAIYTSTGWEKCTIIFEDFSELIISSSAGNLSVTSTYALAISSKNETVRIGYFEHLVNDGSPSGRYACESFEILETD